MVFSGGRKILACGQSLASLGDDMAQRFNQVGVGIEDLLHGGVSYFEDFSLLDSDDVCGSRLTSEQRHLTKESSVAERSNCARPSVFADLHANAAVMHDEH